MLLLIFISMQKRIIIIDNCLDCRWVVGQAINNGIGLLINERNFYRYTPMIKASALLFL